MSQITFASISTFFSQCNFETGHQILFDKMTTKPLLHHISQESTGKL